MLHLISLIGFVLNVHWAKLSGLPATDRDAEVDVDSDDEVDEPDSPTRSANNGRGVADRFLVPQSESINSAIMTFLKARSERTLLCTPAFNALHSGTPIMIVDVHTHLPTHRPLLLP